MKDAEFAAEVKALRKDSDAVLVRIDRLIQAALTKSANAQFRPARKRKVRA